MSQLVFVVGKDPRQIDGGSETYVRAFGRAAIQLGYQPHLFCVGPKSEVEPTEFGVVHQMRSPFRPVRGLMVAAHGRYLVKGIDEFISNRRGPHLIHSFGAWGGVGLAASRRLQRRGLNSKFIATAFTTYAHETIGKLRGLSSAHGPSTWARFALETAWVLLTVNAGEHRGYRAADWVAVNYDSVRRIIESEVGDGIRFYKMTYASETAFQDWTTSVEMLPEIAALTPKEAPLIVSVSRHDPRKGIDVLIGSLARLRAREVAFRAALVGGGSLLSMHRQLVQALNLSDHVAVLGRIPDVRTVLARADIFALPSIEEGSGSVSLLEAMQSRTAPVVSRVDGLPEDVVDGDSALLVEPGDPDVLADALQALLTDGGLRRRLADNAYRQFEARFSAAALVKDLARIYESLDFHAGRRE
jgi:glycosyltransferase involved in cell wall biosynthesis